MSECNVMQYYVSECKLSVAQTQKRKMASESVVVLTTTVAPVIAPDTQVSDSIVVKTTKSTPTLSPLSQTLISVLIQYRNVTMEDIIMTVRDAINLEIPFIIAPPNHIAITGTIVREELKLLEDAGLVLKTHLASEGDVDRWSILCMSSSSTLESKTLPRATFIMAQVDTLQHQTITENIHLKFGENVSMTTYVSREFPKNVKLPHSGDHDNSSHLNRYWFEADLAIKSTCQARIMADLTAYGYRSPRVHVHAPTATLPIQTGHVLIVAPITPELIQRCKQLESETYLTYTLLCIDTLTKMSLDDVNKCVRKFVS